ncbi:hypothetical protein Tco_0141362, partial [Tanacetum coccineum]
MGCLPRSACLRLLCLTHPRIHWSMVNVWRSRNTNGGMENLRNSEWSGPAGFELARENLKSRIEEEDSITNVENAVLDLGVMKSLSSLFVDQRVLVSLIT